MGVSQSEKAARFFAQRKITAIYVSAYLRTRQTAEPLAERLGIQPVVDERLNEIDNGLIEGLDDEMIASQYPQVWSAYNKRDRDFRFPNGETGAEAQSRIVDFLSQMRAESDNMLAVSHDGLIRAAFCYVVGIPVYTRFDFQVDTCGLMEIQYSAEDVKWKLVRFNQAVG
jgi:broad specificity phosphatase PhoE